MEQTHYVFSGLALSSAAHSPQRLWISLFCASPRGFILSLSAPFSCSSRRCNFVLLGAPLPFISSDASSSASPRWLASKKLAESRRRCQSRAGSQSHRNLSEAPAASPPHIHFSSALLPTDALLDFSSHLSHMSLFFSVYFPFSTKQQLLNRRLLPLTSHLFLLHADFFSRTQPPRSKSPHSGCVLANPWTIPHGGTNVISAAWGFQHKRIPYQEVQLQHSR